MRPSLFGSPARIEPISFTVVRVEGEYRFRISSMYATVARKRRPPCRPPVRADGFAGGATVAGAATGAGSASPPASSAAASSSGCSVSSGSAGVPPSLHYAAPFFSALDPEDRNNKQFTGSVSYTLAGTRG